ncbi:dephospho-CoA kinase [Afifella sp. IM 167]|uniref:dephospho-CoA kinase n=1 Tax=Afifella sp. IM 167 TaxID=2033586 RepID=UPI001CCC71A5|nr:dephospho-CoA kinase [Afifella sp. IM 167]MBZ8133532.1 dephospho-CoA kinase [Afifella sp. IM 167]
MIVLGLTGSMAMGKSTTAAMFRARGLPVHDSDRTVHRLYRGAAVEPIEAAFPGVTEDGEVDRRKLGAALAGDFTRLKRLEAIVHPLVRAETVRFAEAAAQKNARAILLDIPLLFETGAQKWMDVVIVVSTTPEIQRQRVLARRGMTEELFAKLLARQIPDAQKRLGAHFVIDTGHGLEAAERDVGAILKTVATMG